MTDETGTSAGSGGRGATPPPFRPRSFFNSPGVKFVLIVVMTVMLMVPSLFVWVLVEERADRAREVARDIAGSWGGTQEVNGPYLIVPFSETVTTGSGDKHKTEVHWKTAILFPEKLDVKGDLQVEERRKSIYSLPVYSGAVSLTGRFGTPPANMFEPQQGGTVDIAADKALLVIGIGDVRALKNEVSLFLDDGATIAFEPGPGPMTIPGGPFKSAAAASSGINAGVPPLKWRKGFSFRVPLELNGSTAVYVAPAGQSTSVELASNWPHPGFTGAFLPDSRTITETGFDATWSIPYLARGIPKTLVSSQLPLQSKLLGVKFVEPVNFYQTISRSLKYAIAFISLTFLAVFVLELRSGWRFHWIQYGLVGLALIIFYVMLLALAEHVGYGLAYLGAASAATVLNAVYVGTSLRSRSAGLVMFAVLATIFALLFALMREQDYALLIGSAIAFLALAVTMFVTQRIDWTGQGETPPGQPAAAG